MTSSEPGSYRVTDNYSLTRPLWHEKNAVFLIRFFYILSGFQRNQSMQNIRRTFNQKLVQQDTDSRKTHYPDVQRNDLSDSSSFIAK